MRILGLTLASLALLLTACGGGDDNGDDDGSSPSASESTQTEGTDSSTDGAESEGAESEDAEGDDPSDGPTGDEGGSVEDLEAAFTEYTEAFFAGTAGDAYAFLSPRCQKETKAKDFGESAEAISEAFGDKFKLKITDSDVEDGRGMVEAEYGSPELDQALATDKYDWIYDGGSWLLDGCA